MKLVSASQMREMDRRTIEEIGIPGVVLMETAGRGAVEHLLRRFGDRCPGPVLVLAGKGNNGGDGYVIARCLLGRGWQVRTVVLAAEEAIGGDAEVNLRALLKCGGEVSFARDEEGLDAALAPGPEPALIVDALLGTGLATEVRGIYAAAIDRINAAGKPVVAVDIPSGLDATSGKILGRAVQADLTVTFASAKVGQAVFPGASLVGELVIVDIGIPPVVATSVDDGQQLVEGREAVALLPARPVTGHKGTFGHLLVVAGSPGKSGAATMTAEGALRSGAGLVTVGCPGAIHGTLENKLTEAMTCPLPEVDGRLSLQALGAIEELWQGRQAMALGPGLEQAEETVALVRRLVRDCPLPLVIDADGINALGETPEILGERPKNTTILTPHPGEMARLTGQSVAEIEADRLGAARDFATRYGVILVLKGARTVTAFADGQLRINGSGNPGMASGGMGDVLTGLIGGLLAQGLPPQSAATLGVYLHGLAADRVADRYGDAGLIATDVLRELPAARRELADFAP